MSFLKGCWQRFVRSSKPKLLSVPIQNLPAAVANFQGGGCYAIGCGNPGLYATLTDDIIKEARRSGIPVAIFMFHSDDASVSIQKDNVDLGSSRVQKFLLAADFVHQILKRGPEPFLRHVEDSLSCTEPALIMFLDRDDHIRREGENNASLIHALKAWSKVWGHLIMLHSGSSESNRSGESLFEQFRGNVSIHREWNQLYWDISHWISEDLETTRQMVYGVHYDDSNRLIATGLNYSSILGQYISAPDERRVYIAEELVGHETVLPSEWIAVTDVFNVDEYLLGAMAPTLILPYTKNHSFEAIARLIDQIRRLLGRGIKIILRETDVRLRTYQERLLLHIGLNHVVHPFERTQELIHDVDNLRGVAFLQHKDGTDLDQLLFAIVPPAAKGYLSPLTFCRTLLKELNPLSPFDVQHMLVRLDLLPGITQLDALTRFRPNRPGDLLTADNRELYIFFFGCSPADVGVALEHCFPEDLGQLFSFDTHWSSAAVILEKTRELKKQWEREEPEDFSFRFSTFEKD